MDHFDCDHDCRGHALVVANDRRHDREIHDLARQLMAIKIQVASMRPVITLAASVVAAITAAMVARLV